MRCDSVNLSTTITRKIITTLGKINGGSINQKVRMINLFAQRTVSLEKAAELSGETLVDFMDILKEQRYPWGEYPKITHAKMIG